MVRQLQRVSCLLWFLCGVIELIFRQARSFKAYAIEVCPYSTSRPASVQEISHQPLVSKYTHSVYLNIIGEGQILQNPPDTVYKRNQNRFLILRCLL